jgi:ABC-2 type transport system permease protein
MVTAYYQGKYILDTLLSTLQESFIFEGELLNGNLIIYIILNSLWFHVPLILMIVVSGMLSAEFKDGTIQSVLLQSVKRRDFIISKYLTAVLFTLLVLLLLAVSTIAASYLIFGQGDLIVYFESLNIFSQADAQIRIIGAFITGTNTMVFYSVVAMTLAVLFRDPAKVWILAGLFLILSTLLSKIDFGPVMNEVLFVKHLDTCQYFFFYSLDLRTIVVKSLILLAYSAVITIVGVKLFLKQELE